MTSAPGATEADPDTVFALAGGGVYVLRADVNFESDYSALQSGGEDVILRLGETAAGVQGYGHELALTDEHVYVAAGRMGIARFRRSDWVRDLVMEIDPAGMPVDEEVWTISVVDYPDRDIVVAGTHAGTSDGRVLVFDTSQAPSLRLRWGHDANAQLYTVVASKDLAADTLHLFAGSACGGLIGAEVDTSTQPWTFPSMPQYSGSNTAGFPRDLALDLRNPSELRLYVAAFVDGVQSWKIQLSPLSLTPDTTGGWPILVSSGPTGRLYCDALAFDATNGRLAVALGPFFAGERQYSTGCEKPVPCMLSYVDYEPSEIGANVYTLSAPPSAPVLEADYTLVPDDNSTADIIAIGASMRAAPPGSSEGWDYYVDCASAGEGAKVVAKDLLEPSTQPADQPGSWDAADLVPIPTNDTCIIQDDVLYVTTERAIPTYDLLASPSDLLGKVEGIALAPIDSGVGGITGFPSPSGRLYGIGPDKISFYETDSQGPLHPVTQPGPALNAGGKCLLARTMNGLHYPTEPVTQKRWLAVGVYNDYAAPTGTARGAIKIWDVGFATQPSDPNAPPIGTLALPDTRFFDVFVRVVGATTAIGYASYNRQLTTGDPPVDSYEFGLMRFWMRAGDPQIGERPIVFYNVETVPAVTKATVNQVWRVHYDPVGDYVYVALGCAGFAVYHDSDGIGALTFLGHKTFPEAAVFEVQRAWGNKLYVSTLNDGFMVFDDLTNISSGSYTVYNVRYQSFGFVIDPSVPDRRGVFVAGGAGGLDRMDFTGQ